ncbi:MAG: hypothetical protein E4H32_07375 [Nitrospirales bacterium]|nr:MAG: hypothetical protein E4H32_07375 [Nitrospirales bacterium]
MKTKPLALKISLFGPAGVNDELVDAASENNLRSEKIDLFDIAEAAIYLERLDLMLRCIKLSWIV